jgi:hypothetical protein
MSRPQGEGLVLQQLEQLLRGAVVIDQLQQISVVHGWPWVLSVQKPAQAWA